MCSAPPKIPKKIEAKEKAKNLEEKRRKKRQEKRRKLEEKRRNNKEKEKKVATKEEQVAKETNFDFWGFIFVTLAAVMSGFRWSMTQILLQKDSYGLKDPITLMSHVTPVMAIATMVLSLLLDPWSDFRKNAYFDNPWHVMRSFLLMLIGGSLAFFMVLTEYILVSATSAITVTIAGVVKESVTILVAVFYFHDEFTWLKGFGLITIMVGVSLFNWYKYEKFKKGQINEDEVNSPSFNGDAKYIILDDLEYQDEFQDEDT